MNLVRLHARSWDAAIKAVRTAVRELPARFALTDAQMGVLGAVVDLCDQAKSKRRLVHVPTDADLAKKYAVSERTVRNWRKAGCPFGRGQWRVLDWMAARPYVPAGAKAKFAKQLDRAEWRGLRAGLQFHLNRARQLKLAYRLNGMDLPADDWLRNFRCPKR